MDALSSSGAIALPQTGAQVSDRISMSVMGMIRNQQESEGQQAVDLIESARLAKEPGKGRMIDVTG